MKPLLILNDLHIGVKRCAGTTPASAHALRAYLLRCLEDILWRHANCDVVINGDLFDEFTIDLSDLLATYHVLSDFLAKGSKLTLVRGNHDYSPKGTACSSFDVLADVLSYANPDRVQVICSGIEEIRPGIWAIPHMPNQECFDLELDKAAALDGGILLTHCNMMPPECYSRHDHSLTIEEPRARALTKKLMILNAHEHQRIAYNMGKGILCLGNQFPSSVADCLSKGRHQEDGKKYALSITPDMNCTDILTWDAAASFQRVDWRDLEDAGNVQFIRIEGDAKAEEAALVIDAIAKLRSKHDAFVISNAVQIEGQEGVEDAAMATYESLKGFNIMEALLAELSAEERKVIEEVLHA